MALYKRFGVESQNTQPEVEDEDSQNDTLLLMRPHR